MGMGKKNKIKLFTQLFYQKNVKVSTSDHSRRQDRIHFKTLTRGTLCLEVAGVML